MSEDKELLKDSAYPSNSKVAMRDPRPSPAETTSDPEKKPIQKVVTGTVKTKRRSVGKKLADTFLEDDTKSVGSYILHDVLIPAAKALISDVIGGGIEMLLFGDRGSRSGSIFRRDGRSFTSYGAFYRGSDRDRDRDNRDRNPRDRDRRDVSRYARAQHDFREVVMETRSDAEDVLAHMVDRIYDYGEVTVAAFYDLVGVTGDYTDEKYGWTDLRGVSPRRVRDGYVLDLPRTRLLD